MSEKIDRTQVLAIFEVYIQQQLASRKTLRWITSRIYEHRSPKEAARLFRELAQKWETEEAADQDTAIIEGSEGLAQDKRHRALAAWPLLANLVEAYLSELSVESCGGEDLLRLRAIAARFEGISRRLAEVVKRAERRPKSWVSRMWGHSHK
jgi:hypothetical protein